MSETNIEEGQLTDEKQTEQQTDKEPVEEQKKSSRILRQEKEERDRLRNEKIRAKAAAKATISIKLDGKPDEVSEESEESSESIELDFHTTGEIKADEEL